MLVRLTIQCFQIRMRPETIFLKTGSQYLVLCPGQILFIDAETGKNVTVADVKHN